MPASESFAPSAEGDAYHVARSQRWLRQRVTKGAGSRTKSLLMAYKLLDMAQARWQRLDGAHLLPLVRGDAVNDSVAVLKEGRRAGA
jgi:hypothetical protein